MFSLRPAPPIAALSGGPRQIGPFTAVAELGIGRRTTALVAFESGTPRALRVAHDGVDRTAFDTDLRAARAFDPSTALELTDVGDTLVAHGPLVVGESLATILEQTFASHRPADLGVALALASRAAAKLAAAGERRVHGDLVPHHVLVGYDGQVHLVDAVGGAYRERARAPGRAPYRSPEHVRGEPLTPASDVFVLGILLFELTTATPLFGGPSQRDPDGAIVQAKLPRPRELVAEGYPIELELILRKMLRPAAAGRFTDGAGVVEALRLYRGRRAEPTAEELGAWLAS
ncbi:protein kinase, partial [Myxococcota bacterium]|nr:protein kinase [Myxococcota bacterium]